MYEPVYLRGPKYHRRIPDIAPFNSYESDGFADVHGNSSVEAWVTARFAPEQWGEGILFLGDDPGNIAVYDVDKVLDSGAPSSEKLLHGFAAHKGTIMDVMGVPNQLGKIVSISGDSSIRLWDLNSMPHTSSLFFGHEATVRTISFSPENSNVFVTGDRNGEIRIWDMRTVDCQRKGKVFKSSISRYWNAHLLRTRAKEENHPNPSTPKSKGKKFDTPGPSVTSLVFIDDKVVASGSADFKSGIRLWDIRKPPHNDEGYIMSCLRIPATEQRTKGFGISSLAVDRFHSSLFAACTNSVVYEYAITTTNLDPIRSFTGPSIRDFYIQVACSPISDHIICGSVDEKAYIWDLQDYHRHFNEPPIPPDSIEQRRAAFPKWTCTHGKGVWCVGWSHNAKYLLTQSEAVVRVWKEPANDTAKESAQKRINYEKLEPYVMTPSEGAMLSIDSMCISPRVSASTSFTSPKKGRNPKRPLIKSPFKSSFTPPTTSPMAKVGKFTSPNKESFPLHDVTNASESTRHRTPHLSRKLGVGAFYKKFPTENLPNHVYDKFVKNLVGSEAVADVSKLSKTSKKRIEDWWQKVENKEPSSSTGPIRMRLPSVTEFGESACASLVSQEQRLALKSPRKIVLRSTPVKQIDVVFPTLQPATPKTPKTPKTPRRTSRNLFHYFNSTPK